MGESRGLGRPENCETGAGEGSTSVHHDRVVAAVTAPPVGQGDLEALLKRLLPAAPVQTPPPRPIPTEMEILLERLLSGALASTLTPPPQTGIMGMETLLQRLLPGTPVPALRSRPGPARRDWTTIMCFSCGKQGHGVGRCPELNEAFPYMLLGWSAEKEGANYIIINNNQVQAKFEM